jgi:ribonuclease BN (tRNA processing enzyme)
MPEAKPRAIVRMYRHGLGDCFLVRFTRDDGGLFSILIDCGLIGVATDPKQKMAKVVADIRSACKDRIDVVIMTHEHWDHASGFSVQQAQQSFDSIKIGEVWYAWTEHPENDLGSKLRAERAAKIKAAKKAARALLAQSDDLLARERGAGVASLLQFFGVDDLAADDGKMGKSLEAFWYLRNKRRDVKTRYCFPEKDPFALPGVTGVRAFFLGPPEDEGLIKRGESKKDDLYAFAGDLAADENLAAAFERLHDPASRTDDTDCPFEDTLRRFPWDPTKTVGKELRDLIQATWEAKSEVGRKIENDWTAAAEALALNLDNHTNNTCLVVAFELSPGGNVLLFAADAQIGNWTSWKDRRWTVSDAQARRVVTGPDLLQRTVFYKVGHHGSHNATMRQHGLEQMTSDDLIAFVPVFAKEARKNRWFGMPFEPLVKRLNEKTSNRVVYSDDEVAKPAIVGLTAGADGLYYEYAFDR